MTPQQIERVFGRGRLKMVTGDHVEVFREAAPPGERRRYTKRFLETGDADFRQWTEREWRILARLIGHRVRCVPDVVQFDAGATGVRQVQTYDAGITVDQWATLLPVARNEIRRRHVFEDCAHWWALAHHCLAGLDEIHALQLVHLDIKADNICIPYEPADFDATAAGVRLCPMFERLTLIDFAFSLVSRERLATALPLGWQKDYDYQSPRLLRALEAGLEGDLGPTQELDWRCDLYSLAAMLRRYLPDADWERSEAGAASGWTVRRYDEARSFVYRLRDCHDRDLPPARPHQELLKTTSAHLRASDVARSLAYGWTIAHDCEDVPVAALITPMTRIAAPRAAVTPAVLVSPAYRAVENGPAVFRTTRIRVFAPPREDDPAVVAPRTARRWLRLAAAACLAGVTAIAATLLVTERSSRDSSAPALASAPGVAAVHSADEQNPTQSTTAATPVGSISSTSEAAPTASAPTSSTTEAAPSARVSEVQVAAADIAVATAQVPARAPDIPVVAPDVLARAAGTPVVAADVPARAADTPVAAAEVPAPTPDMAVAAADAPAHLADVQTPPPVTAPAANVVASDKRAARAGRPLPPPSRVSRPASSRASPSLMTSEKRQRPPMAAAAGSVPRSASGTAMPLRSRASPPVQVAAARSATQALVAVSTSPPKVVTASNAAPTDAAAAPPIASTANAAAAALPSTTTNVLAESAAPSTAAAPGPPAEHATAASVAATTGTRSAPTRRMAPPAQRDVWRDTLHNFMTALGITEQAPAPVEDRSMQAPRPTREPARSSASTTQAVPAPMDARPVDTSRILLAAAPAPQGVPAPATDASANAAVQSTPPLRFEQRDESQDALRAEGRRILNEDLPRVATQARSDLANVLWMAATAEDPTQQRAVANAVFAHWAGEQTPFRGARNAGRARMLHAQAKRAFASGRDNEAVDLELRAFAAHPSDPDIAGYLGFLYLRVAPMQAETARQLALHALTASGSSRISRLDDWNTFAVASALSGRDVDATRALLVELALTTDLDRSCRAAIGAYTMFGERLRGPVQAMLYRVRAQGRDSRSTSCAWPAVRTATASQ